MKALKGLLIYIGIVLGIILGIGLILLCIMYFAPSVRIFGLGVVHYNKTVTSDPIYFSDYTDYSDIEINLNSKKISISVLPADVENIEYALDLSIFGISTEIVEYQVVKNVEVNGGKLNIFLNVSEPSGWISTSDSKLVVKVPTTGKYNLVINSKKGNVSLGDDDELLSLNNLTISTDTGSLSLVNLGSGEKGNKTLTLNTLNLTTGNGVCDFSAINNLSVNNKIKLVADGGKFKFDNLNASVDITGNEVTLSATNITTGADGFKVIAKNGFFSIAEKLTTPVGAENTFMTDNTTLNISEVTGRTGVVTEYGTITIGTLNDYTRIENTNGAVSITKANGDIAVTTTMGNITVDEYYQSGEFVSKRGDITVNSLSEYNKEYRTIITNVDGRVIVENKINQLLVTTTGRSPLVKITFREIKTGFTLIGDDNPFQHRILVNEQAVACEVFIPTAPVVPFSFTAKGSISGEIAGFAGGDYYEVEASDQVQYYPGISSKEESFSSASFYFEGKINFNGWTPTLNS